VPHSLGLMNVEVLDASNGQCFAQAGVDVVRKWSDARFGRSEPAHRRDVQIRGIATGVSKAARGEPFEYRVEGALTPGASN